MPDDEQTIDRVRRSNARLGRRFIDAINDSWHIDALDGATPYRNEYIGRFTVRDGKIMSFAEYLDPTRFVIAIGGTVAPPADPSA